MWTSATRTTPAPTVFARTRSALSPAPANPAITWRTTLVSVNLFSKTSLKLFHQEMLFLCKDVDECVNSPCIDGTCVNEPGSYLCLCEPGYTLERNVCIGTHYNKVSVGFKIQNLICFFLFWNLTRFRRVSHLALCQRNLRQSNRQLSVRLPRRLRLSQQLLSRYNKLFRSIHLYFYQKVSCRRGRMPVESLCQRPVRQHRRELLVPLFGRLQSSWKHLFRYSHLARVSFAGQ